MEDTFVFNVPEINRNFELVDPQEQCDAYFFDKKKSIVQNEDSETKEPSDEEKSEFTENSSPDLIEKMELENEKENTKDGASDDIKPKNTLPNKAIQEITEGVPERQSPRLAAIAKALRRKNSSTRTPNSAKTRSRSADAGAINRVHSVRGAAKTPSKIIPKLKGLNLLSNDDKTDLTNIASIKNKMASNKAKSNISSKMMVTNAKEIKFGSSKKSKINSSDQKDFNSLLRSNSAKSQYTPKTTKVQPFNLLSARRRSKSYNDAIAHMKTYACADLGSYERIQQNKDSINDIPQALNSTTRSSSTRSIASDYEAYEKKIGCTLADIKTDPKFNVSTSSIPAAQKSHMMADNMLVGSQKLNTKPRFLAKINAQAAHTGVFYDFNNVGPKKTAPKPFSFHKRDQETQKKKEERIQKELEEKKRLAAFRASPMPSFKNSIAKLPEKKPPAPTQVKPFNLRTLELGSVKQEALEKELKIKETEEKIRRKFRARSDRVVREPPFVPEKSNKPLTDISGFTLNTEKRLEDRANFDNQIKEKQNRALMEKYEKQLEEEEKQKAELAKERRRTVHKAQPVPNFKPVRFKPLKRAVSVPKTPNLSTKTRMLKPRLRPSDSLNSVNSIS